MHHILQVFGCHTPAKRVGQPSAGSIATKLSCIDTVAAVKSKKNNSRNTGTNNNGDKNDAKTGMVIMVTVIINSISIIPSRPESLTARPKDVLIKKTQN